MFSFTRPLTWLFVLLAAVTTKIIVAYHSSFPVDHEATVTESSLVSAVAFDNNSGGQHNSLDEDEDEDAFPTVICRLELQLDQHPEEVGWEIRGPLPDYTIVDGVTFDWYGQSQANQVVEEIFELRQGGRYYFFLQDGGSDGVEGGYWKLVGEYENHDIILKGDYTDTARHGRMWAVAVPSQSQLQGLDQNLDDDDDRLDDDDENDQLDDVDDDEEDETGNDGATTDVEKNALSPILSTAAAAK